jgi:hypothetical protein
MFRPVLILIFLSAPLCAAGDVFCDDPAIIADWERKATVYREDEAIQTLHGLWLGLCAKIRAGTIEPDMAIDIFDREHAKQVLERAQDELSKPGSSGI